jgi:hypothetical protein
VISGAIFIVLDMSHPLQGVIKVSSAPMRRALENLGQWRPGNLFPPLVRIAIGFASAGKFGE